MVWFGWLDWAWFGWPVLAWFGLVWFGWDGFGLVWFGLSGRGCLCAGVFACVLVPGNALRHGVSLFKKRPFLAPLVRQKRAFFKNPGLVGLIWLAVCACVLACLRACLCWVMRFGSVSHLLKNVLFWAPLVRKIRAFFLINLAWLPCVLACLRACLWPVMRFGIGLVGWWGGRWDGWLVWFGLAWFGLVRSGSF